MLAKLMPLGTLQQLVLDGNSYDSYMNSKTDILGAAQHLEQLTYLRLGRLYTQDTVLRNVRHVSHLQKLVLQDSVSTAGGLDALPASLTSLEISLMSGRQYERLFITQRPRAVFSASDTPGLLQLTGLQHLKISNADAVHASVLSALCSLTHLDVSQLSMAGDLDQGGPGVSALTTLTNLQHLHVRSVAQGSIPVAVTAADINALTLSSHPTYLGLGAGVVSEQDYLCLFLPGRKLPALKELTATMQLLSHPDTMEALAAACEGLQTLKLIDSVEGEPIEGWLDEEDGSERYSWLPLQSLSALTALHLELKGHDVSQAAWECLGGVSQLKCLDLGSVSLRSFPGVMQLAGLTGLEQLRLVAGGNELTWLKAECAAPTEVVLPAFVLEQAIQIFDDQQEDGAGSNSAMVCLVRAAAAQVRTVYARQYQQQQLHTKEVAELRAQLQQQQLLQEQQLADLRIQQEEQRLLKRKLAVLHAKQQQQQVLSQELHELRTKQHQVAAMQQRLAALEQQMQALLLQQQAKQQ